ncbi:MAG: LysR family transcriptional regulator [Actinobacteria bacterium]|nr:LysR family transcriptional regulator [Actinomycetota bacterium]
MNLRQLAYLAAVGRERGIRAAARALHISQPQISQAVRSLEEELGVELIRRSPRGIEITPEGEELIARAEDIVARVEDAAQAVREMRGRAGSTLRVGVLAGALGAAELLPPILADHRAAHPDVDLRLEDLAFCDQVSPVLDGRLDAAIVRLPLGSSEVEVMPLAVEPRVAMVGAGHELAGESSIDIEQILDFPTLPLDSSVEWSDYWQLNDFRGGANWDPEMPPIRTVPEAQLALATRDLLITSPAAIGRLAPNPLVRVLQLTGASDSTIAVVHRRRPDPAVRRFAAIAQATAEREIGLIPGGYLPA